MGKLKIDFLRSMEDIDLNKERWERLYSSSDASPYLSHEWFATTLKHFQKNGQLLVGVASYDDTWIGIVPLELARERVGVVHVRVLRFPIEWWSGRNGAIVDKHWDPFWIVREVIRASMSVCSGWRYCRLSNLSGPSPTNGRRMSGGPIPLDEETNVRGRFVVIETGTSWESYRQTLSRSHRNNISRYLKALERKGAVRFQRFGPDSDPADPQLGTLLHDALRVSANSWQHVARGGWAISDTTAGNFFPEVSKNLAAKNRLDLSVLYLDNRPISFLWGAARWPRTYLNKSGYDQSFPDLSPGLVHLTKHIMDSIGKGVLEIDLGSEFFEYKSKWGKRYDVLFDRFYYPHGAIPALIRNLHSIRPGFNELAVSSP
jgi:CelD/BcsL family acetyltransferase involved in cellulose biosynthesis